LAKSGRNPAEVVYGYAKTLGYQRKEAAAVKPNGAAGSVVQAAAAAAAKPDASAARTLGAGGAEASAGDDGEESGMSEFKAALKERFRR
jgi:hypothetical protein